MTPWHSLGLVVLGLLVAPLAAWLWEVSRATCAMLYETWRLHRLYSRIEVRCQCAWCEPDRW